MMNKVVSIVEKKEFIQWFLDTYQCKLRESVCLLNYIKYDDKLLSRVHFTNRFENLPKVLCIAATCAASPPFRFIKNRRVRFEVERAFHDIRLNKDEEIYVVLFYKNRDICPKYALVLEENPMKERYAEQENLIGLLAEITLDQAIHNYKEKQIYDEIDKALSLRDEPRFLQLTSELNRLKNLKNQ